ncbi:hypothetical protein [Pelagibacterium lentulum]|uniref:Uncharacterized protein n=1 Tax=Pelagibacterium lentulum TaxID=2029865 RepID=A0A916RAR0_9HYPH|nr:hypothetical protein [Pelagibacterium lentulum]GGA46391.1 hypothetical protein GCM10011499_15180 [Pelagibacterium lentulum]
MATDKNISTYFQAGGVRRSPKDIAQDSTLSNARKIELLRSYKYHHAAPKHKAVIRDVDLELSKLMKLNSLANER